MVGCLSSCLSSSLRKQNNPKNIFFKLEFLGESADTTVTQWCSRNPQRYQLANIDVYLRC